MSRIASVAFVITAWSVAPLIKRRILDYMADPELLVPGPTRTFVAVYSLGCTVVCSAIAYPTGPQAFLQRMPAEGWSLLLFGVTLGSVASIVLTQLISSGNPGLVMVHMNAGTNVLSYVMGALLYGKLSWSGMAGVIAISVGVALTTQ